MTSGASESQKPSHADQVGTWAGTLALAEVGVGSFLHAAHIPMTGTMLSLNQALFLSRITRLNHDLPGARSLGFEISSVTALLKSFAPVGKRLTPMLAIGVQGLLFTAGTTIFGPTLIGVIAGSMLLAVWGIAQPAILAGVMVATLSETEWQRIQGAWEKLVADVTLLENFSLVTALFILLGAKCLLAGILAILAWNSPVGRPNTLLSRWESFINRRVSAGPTATPRVYGPGKTSLWMNIKLALKDLRHPMVWISAALMGGLSYFLDSAFIDAVWITLRGLAGVFIVYLLLRLLPWDRWLNPENRHARALRSAILVIRGRDEHTDASPRPDASEFKS